MSRRGPARSASDGKPLTDASGWSSAREQEQSDGSQPTFLWFAVARRRSARLPRHNGRRSRRLRGGHDATECLATSAAGRRAEEATEALHSPLARGRSEPTGDVGSQTRSDNRRTISGHPDFRSGHPDFRVDATNGQADEAYLHHPFAEHAQRRSRWRRATHDAWPARRAEPEISRPWRSAGP